MSNLKVINAEEGFLEAIHLLQEVTLYLNYGKGEGYARRKQDGYMADFERKLNGVFLKYTKSNNE
jgi:hypothetical protein